MFHVELRQFPHNACAFNLNEAELLQTLVIPWSQEQWVELGERKWNPHQARLTVLEGPHLPVEDLAMGRGWRNAQHQSEDVTERVLARARGAARGSRSSERTPASELAAPARSRSGCPAASLAPGRPAPPRAGAERVACAGRTDATLAGRGACRHVARLRSPHLVGVAQLVELLVVVQAVGGSSPLAHPHEIAANRHFPLKPEPPRWSHGEQTGNRICWNSHRESLEHGVGQLGRVRSQAAW